jgi:hypothetical protein
MVGASFTRLNKSSSPFVDTYVVPAGPSKGITISTPGSLVLNTINEPDVFARYEKDRFMIAGEYQRSDGSLYLVGLSPYADRFDSRPWYGMASYKVTGKLTAGIYDTQDINHADPLGPARYFKDWAISGRYDFSQYVYAKAEEHIIDGTSVGFDANLNPTGTLPATKLTVLKIGVSF